MRSSVTQEETVFIVPASEDSLFFQCVVPILFVGELLGRGLPYTRVGNNPSFMGEKAMVGQPPFSASNVGIIFMSD